MNAAMRLNEEHLKALPRGFSILDRTPDTLVLDYKRNGMGCMVSFLAVWLIGWGGALVAGFLETSKISPLLLVMLVPEVVILGVLLYFLTLRTECRLGPSEITVEYRIFKFRWVKVLRRNAIESVRHIKDGGGGEDSFPSWCLRIDGDGRINLLPRQPYESSRWLGELVASWAGVPFNPAPDDRPGKKGLGPR